MSDAELLYVDCGAHGKRVAAVVCRHMLEPTAHALGFVENSSDPHDLQAWCDECEQAFLEAGDKTDFHQISLVCVECYAELKARHSR